MRSFFCAPRATDPAYTNLRDGRTDWLRDAHEYIEELWQVYEPYADHDFVEAAGRKLQPRFWEMYLACSLVESCVNLTKRSMRKHSEAGPDVEVAEPHMWVEAVAPERGSSDDAVPEMVNGQCRTVPDDAISLRLLSAIKEKREKHFHYVERGIVRADEPFVIAINAASIPSARQELPVPRIVRSVFPIGDLQIHIDARTFEATGTSYTSRHAVKKRSGVSIPTTLFQDRSSADISAILYSSTDPCNRPAKLGGDFVVVQNPMAAVPLPDGVFRRGVIYWSENGEIRHRKLS